MGAPATQGKRYTEDENEVIRKLFPELGPMGVQIYLPHRPIQSIQKQAGRMGVYKRGSYGPQPVRNTAASLHPHWPAQPGALRGAI